MNSKKLIKKILVGIGLGTNLLFNPLLAQQYEYKTAYTEVIKNRKQEYYNFLLNDVIPKVEKDIETIIKNGWSDDVNKNDLMHVHLVRSKQDKEFEDYIDKDKVYLLYHTREYLGHINKRYSVVSKLNGEIKEYDIFKAPQEYFTGNYEYVGTFFFDNVINSSEDQDNEFKNWDIFKWSGIDFLIRTDKYIYAFNFEGD